MNQTSKAIKLLKAQLRIKGITHETVADQLGVGVAAVRRWLNPHNTVVHMKKFELMCAIADTSLSQLLSQVETIQTYTLADLDEDAYVQDKMLMLIGFLVINGWNFKQISGSYNIKKPEIMEKLVMLENLGVISKLDKTKGNFECDFSSKFTWKAGGKMDLEMRRLTDEFIAKPVDQDTDKQAFVPFMLSQDASTKIDEAIDTFIEKLHRIVQVDSTADKTRDGYSILISKKKWVYSEFKPYSSSFD